MNKYITGPRIKTLVVTTIGSALYGIGLDAFIIPHNLLAGGLSGVAVMIYYLSGATISAGIANLVLNIPILFAAYRWLGGWAVITAVYGTLACSFFIDEFTYMAHLPIHTSPIVGSITGGILIGFGSGIIYRHGGTTGGVDPIAQIVRKYWGLQMGSVIFAINFAIILVSSILFSIQAAVITLISIYITAVVTNKVVTGLQQQKSVFIISDKPQDLSHEIIQRLGRGCTLLDGVGAYTSSRKQVVMTVVGLMQLSRLKAIVEKVDSNAFLFISDASEVIGQGFTTQTTPAVATALFSSPTAEEKKAVLENTSIEDMKQYSKTVNHNWFHM